MPCLERPRSAPPFYAYCVDRCAVVAANAELGGVEIYKPVGAVYCVSNSVKAGPYAACRVGNGRLCDVEWNDYTKAVRPSYSPKRRLML